ncbi:hypothetical protein [Anaerosporobacter sp.]
MFNSFKVSFRLKNTYRANSIIYTLKSTPLIKKLLPSSLYASRELKIIANVIGAIWEFISIFIWKAMYLLFMAILPLNVLKSSHEASFLHILMILTLIGAIMNNQMFNPTKDKYYAIFLMRMNAKEYAISNYIYTIVKNFIGFGVLIIPLGILVDVPLIACILLPFYIVSVKVIANADLLHDMAKRNKITDQRFPIAVLFVIASVLLIAAYLPPYLGYTIPFSVFYLICAVTFICAILALRYIIKFTKYRAIYKELLLPGSFMNTGTQAAAKVMQNSYQKKLDYSVEQTSNKTGYAYFNELFMKRHSRLLRKSAYRMTGITLIVLIATIIGCFAFPELKSKVNSLMLTYLPYFLFVMYIINRGKVITEAMFMNCDHSMLTYRFYRQPKVILNLFAARLKSVIGINLMPASVISIGLPFLLFLTGGTNNPLNYLVLFISIIAMSVFFSVHNMVLYYVFQPYNIDLENKNVTYSIINSLTYFICYVAIGKQMPTMVFGTIVTGFCIVYIVVALFVAYRFAPKTFKLMR